MVINETIDDQGYSKPQPQKQVDQLMSAMDFNQGSISPSTNKISSWTCALVSSNSAPVAQFCKFDWYNWIVEYQMNHYIKGSIFDLQKC